MLNRLRFELTGALIGAALVTLVPPTEIAIEPLHASLVAALVGALLGIYARTTWAMNNFRRVLEDRLQPYRLRDRDRWESFSRILLPTLAIEEGWRSGPWAMTSPEFAHTAGLAGEAVARCLVPGRRANPLTPRDSYEVARLGRIVEPLLRDHGLLP